MIQRRSGDGFVVCADGRSRWGRYGAAGVVFVFRAGAGPEVLLQLRSRMAHEGGTWSCPGGAIDRGESTLEAGMRESAEEVGEPPARWRHLGEVVFAPSPDWSYTTAVVEVTARFGASLNFETSEVKWVAVEDVAAMELHSGFAATWPAVRAVIERAGEN